MPDMRSKDVITQKELKNNLHYNPETGVFIWIVNRPGVSKGRVAGSPSYNGYNYTRISVNGISYVANRLAVLYMKGYLPEHLVDHKDGDGSNNKWRNLREATTKCNAQNCKVNKLNTSGFPGVHLNKRRNKWCAEIKINYQKIWLGSYSSVIDAALARLTAEITCPEWHCNYQSKLIVAIKSAWPAFSERCLQ